MTARYENLGLLTAWRRFNRSNGAHEFEARMRDIEAGAPSLNLGAENVHLAAEIAALAPSLDDRQRIALILLVVVSLAALQEGSTRFPVTGPESVESMRRLLSPLCSQSPESDATDAARVAIERLLLSGDASSVIGTDATDYKPLIYSAPFIYHHRVRLAEMELARRLATLISASRAPVGATRIRELLSEVTIGRAGPREQRAGLSEEQREAVVSACIAPLTIISGGPGTGKTSIIIAILRLLIRMGVPPAEIALAAPTGKAAYRIGESIRENRPSLTDLPNELSDPSTVHRLLGYSATMRRFRHHRNNPLAARVVIIDEGSMLDLDLMARLLDAIRLDARLVLLGDADQLPSVSAGAVFRDLIPAAESEHPILARASVRLTRSYRTDSNEAGGGAIFKLANAINAGDSSAFDSQDAADNSVIVKREFAAQISFAGTEWLSEEAGKFGEFLDRWYSERIRGAEDFVEITRRTYHASEDGFPPDEVELLRRLFRQAGSARILCITRVLDTGAERINSRLHRRAAQDAKISFDRVAFLAGEPVMILRNDYERLLFNGDQGLVLWVRRPDCDAVPMAVFPRENNFIAFRIDAIKEDLELCYAMTVHKAQGSEFDSVAVIMPEKDIPILTREIIYTAVSRARRSVTIVGSEKIIRAGISRKIERYSGVREELALSLRTSNSK